MTPLEAAKTLDSLAERYRDPRALEALHLAAEALRDDPATTMRAILDASGKTDVPVQLIRSDEGETWVSWLHKGPMVGAKSLPEALNALLEKVTKK